MAWVLDLSENALAQLSAANWAAAAAALLVHCPASYPTRRFARAVHRFLYLRASDTELRVTAFTRHRNLVDRVIIRPQCPST